MNIDISPIAQLTRHARFHRDHIAVVYEGERIDYGDLRERVQALASALAGKGVRDGDRVAYLGLNSLTFLLGYLACAWVGAAFVPINFRLAAPEVEALLIDAAPKVLIAEPAHAEPVAGRVPGDVQTLVVVDDDPAAGPVPVLPGSWLGLTAFVAGRLDDVEPVTQAEGDLAALLYTSGTTGRPKGVMLTHGNIWWNILNQDSYIETRFDDVYLAVAPLFHIGALNTHTLGAIYRGSTVVIRRAFDPAATLDDLVTLPVNGMFAVPAMFAAIARMPGFADADLSQLRLACAAGAPVPPTLLELYAEKGVLIQQAWGLTETAPCSTYLEASEARRKLGSAGVPMPYGEVQVRDLETLEQVTMPSDLGELWVRGPNVSPGYWNNPEATAAAFTADGWFRTGDIGYVDDEGFFFVVDRLKDMVISGGENIYPAEVERVLVAHPEIVDAAVVGTRDDEWGEVVVAVLSLAPGSALGLDQVREFCAAELARYKLPRRLLVVETVTRNGSGKLDKLAIRAQVARSQLVE